MYKVHCFCYLDEFNHKQWPSELLMRPMVGDTVEASDLAQLKIVAVIHSMSPRRQYGEDAFGSIAPEPIIKIELGRSNQ